MTKAAAGAAGARGALRLGAGLLAAALFLLCSAVVVREWRGEHLLAQGRELMETDEERGEELLRQALRHGNEDAAVELAGLSYRRREWDAFHRYADEALRLNPYQGYVHVLRAYALASASLPGSPEEAEKILGECRRAVAVDPASGGLWRSYAELALRIHGHRSASGAGDGETGAYRLESLGAYRRALLLDPGQGPEMVAAAADGGADGFFIAAIVGGAPLTAMRRAVSILLDRGEWEAVREEYRAGAGEGETKRNACRAAVEELRSRKRHGEALDELRDYPFAEPEDAYLAYLAGLSAETLGPEDEAWSETERYYREAVRLDGAKTVYRRQLGIFLFRDASPEEAVTILRQVTIDDPRDAQAWFYLGRAAEGKGDGEEALSHFRKALSLRPENGHYRRTVETLEKKIR